MSARLLLHTSRLPFTGLAKLLTRVRTIYIDIPNRTRRGDISIRRSVRQQKRTAEGIAQAFEKTKKASLNRLGHNG